MSNTTIETDMDIKDLRETLQKLNYGELIDLFMEYSEKDLVFAHAFNLFVISKMRNRGEQYAREAVNHSFNATHISGRRNNYYESRDWYTIMKDKDALFQDAEHALEFGDLRRAVAYPLQWLNRFNEEFTEDALGNHDRMNFEWACDEAMKFIEQVMYHAETDSRLKEEVYKELLALSDGLNVFDKYGFADMKTFTRRMKALIESPEAALGTIEQLMEEGENTADFNALLLQKYQILTVSGKEDEALRLLEDHINKKDICKSLVDILMNKKDYQRALNVLEKALQFGDGFLNCQWLRKEIEIYGLLGDQSQLVVTERRLFIHSAGSMEMYAALKSVIPVEEWKVYLSAMMNETVFYDVCYEDEGNTKAEIFLAENDGNSLFQYMMQIKNDLLEHYSRYALKLSPEQQTELIPQYVEGIRSEASIAKNRDHYVRVCHYISCLNKLQGATEVVYKLVVEFMETYRRKPSFIAELKKLM